MPGKADVSHLANRGIVGKIEFKNGRKVLERRLQRVGGLTRQATIQSSTTAAAADKWWLKWSYRDPRYRRFPMWTHVQNYSSKGALLCRVKGVFQGLLDDL